MSRIQSEDKNKRQREYYHRNRDKRLVEMKEYNARQRYGISREEYDAYFSSEPLCEICTLRKATQLDHCHETGKIRGVLCIRCNTALGTFGDNLKGIENVIKYLEEVI